MKSKQLIKTLRETIDELEEDAISQQARIDELETEVDEDDDDEELTDSIDTGIGTIHFRVEGSIDQQELMEALADIIAREGVRGLMNHLRDVYAV